MPNAGNKNLCPCRCPDNDFRILNEHTLEYSGIELAMNRQGMFRARVLDTSGSMTSQDVANLDFCPLCGRKFTRD